MIRRYCDGCHHRGVARELTEPHYARIRLTDETATVLDLCFDCMPFYESFQKQMDTLFTRSALDFRRIAKTQEEVFWRSIKRGPKKKDEPGTRIEAHETERNEPETERISQR